jgi:hypothetical protein
MRSYIIIGEPWQINFSEVDQNDYEDCVTSELRNEFVISYTGEMPQSIKNCVNKSVEYTDKDILIEELLSPDWTTYGFLDPDPEENDDMNMMRQTYQDEL